MQQEIVSRRETTGASPLGLESSLSSDLGLASYLSALPFPPGTLGSVRAETLQALALTAAHEMPPPEPVTL